MERLTKKNKRDQWVTPFCTRYDDEEFNEHYTGASVSKLAEYEDIAEAITELLNEYQAEADSINCGLRKEKSYWYGYQDGMNRVLCAVRRNLDLLK